MKYTAVVLSVADVKAARGFYEDLFGLEVCQDYGINVSFTCGLSLQQEFDWLVGLQKERIGKKSNNMELCFETEDLDHFLEQLRRYPGAAETIPRGRAPGGRGGARLGTAGGPLL